MLFRLFPLAAKPADGHSQRYGLIWLILVQASKQIYEITRRAARQEVVHLLNYIRTVIDAASRSEELNQRNKYQQEALNGYSQSQT